MYRVAIVGAGPAGFYTAERVLKHLSNVKIDLIERLVSPFGLVRYGVAPDHASVKNVISKFEKIALDSRVNYKGHLSLTPHLLSLLRHYYHGVVLTTGSTKDQTMGIPGESLVWSANQFIHWLNSHPYCSSLSFDLSQSKKAVIVGNGNVAMDVARLLLKSPSQLAQTDIAPYALEALKQSTIEQIHIVARRGPSHAAFTTAEFRDLMSLPGVQLKGDTSLIVDPSTKDRALTRKLDLMKKAFSVRPSIVEKVCHFDFYQSPHSVVSHEHQLTGFTVEKTELVDGKVKGTGSFRTIDTGIVFRSIGLQNEPIEGLGFDSKRGIIPNSMGRVIDPTNQEHVKGVYVAGWAKTGPKGVLLSTMASSQETAECLVQDLKGMTNIDALPELSLPNKPISFQQWQKIDQEEIQRGHALGKSRLKMTTEKEMLDFIQPDLLHPASSSF